MELSFYPKPGRVCHFPGPKFIGQMHAYVGRGVEVSDDGVAHPAQEVPIKVKAESQEGRRLVRLCRCDAALWPADVETSAHVGVNFLETEFVGGEHRMKRGVPPSVKRKAAD